MHITHTFRHSSTTMAFSVFFSRLRQSSSKSINRFIQTSIHHKPQSQTLINTIPTTSTSNNNNNQSWLTRLLPILLTVSGGSLALQSPSLCDAPNLHERYFITFSLIWLGMKYECLCGCRGGRIGGKDSTEQVVKGDYKPVPPELLHQLKAICQVN